MRRRKARAATWELRPIRIPDQTAPVVIGPAGVTIGRDPGNDVELPSASYPGVSARHARVFLADGEPWIEDLDSKNGTLVGGEPVQRAKLTSGSLIELGAGGPRFLVTRETGLDETVALPSARPRERSLGRDTVVFFKEKLGMTVGRDVEERLQAHERRSKTRFFVLGAVLILGLGGGIWLLSTIGDTAVAEMKTRTDNLVRQLEKRLDETRTRFDTQLGSWEEWRRGMDSERTAWSSNKADLEQQRKELRDAIGKLEQADVTATGELTRLRAKLDETGKRLDRYDPVNLERARLAQVARVERTVVMIEVALTYLEEKTKRRLHVARDETGRMRPNFRDEGAPLEKSGSGSGLCFDVAGWILTNAHVVFKKGHEPLELTGIGLVPNLDIQVTWSGTSKRHPARLVSWTADGSGDLALLKVEPFEGMSRVDGIDPSQPAPPRHGEVFLLGFPLGKRAMQEGDKVIASAFRGIVSRFVDDYIQVDAAVHPGASGGPLIDANGRILGLVVGRQRVSRTEAAADIGYVIPIARAAALWPGK